jgi:hypothetical protein
MHNGRGKKKSNGRNLFGDAWFNSISPRIFVRINVRGKVHTQGQGMLLDVRSHILRHLVRSRCKRVIVRRLFDESMSLVGRIWNCGTNNDRTSRPYTQPLAITGRPLASNGPTIDKRARVGSCLKSARHPVGPAHCMYTSLHCPVQHLELLLTNKQDEVTQLRQFLSSQPGPSTSDPVTLPLSLVSMVLPHIIASSSSDVAAGSGTVTAALTQRAQLLQDENDELYEILKRGETGRLKEEVRGLQRVVERLEKSLRRKRISSCVFHSYELYPLESHQVVETLS